MIKKIAIGLIFTLIAGVLVVGAANRTSAKTAQYSPAETAAQTGNGGGQNTNGDRQYANQHEPLNLANEQGGQGGQGQGQNGRSAATTTDQTMTTPLGGQGQGYQGGNGQTNQANQNNNLCDGDCDSQPLNQTLHDELLTFQGVVTVAPAAGVEMVIDTTEGSQIIATGPAQWLETSILLVPGDNVMVTGFWEDGQFKATTITRTSDNLTVTLRDELGRPMWSGSVRNSTNGQGQGRGQGQGQGNGKAQG
jgi:hypothetical protein